MVIVGLGAAWCGVREISGRSGVCVLFKGAAVGVYAWGWMVCMGGCSRDSAVLQRSNRVCWLGAGDVGDWQMDVQAACININGVDRHNVEVPCIMSLSSCVHVCPSVLFLVVSPKAVKNAMCARTPEIWCNLIM